MGGGERASAKGIYGYYEGERVYVIETDFLSKRRECLRQRSVREGRVYRDSKVGRVEELAPLESVLRVCAADGGLREVALQEARGTPARGETCRRGASQVSGSAGSAEEGKEGGGAKAQKLSRDRAWCIRWSPQRTLPAKRRVVLR